MKLILVATMLTSVAVAQNGVLPVTVESRETKNRTVELRLALREGKVVAGIGRANFTRSPAVLDITGLSVVDGKVTGELKVNIGSDGYSAATNFTCQLEAPLANKLQPLPAAGEVARLTLNCENAVNHGSGKAQGRRLQLVLATRDGEVFAGRAVPPGSMTDVNYAARMTRYGVKLVDGKLSGQIEVTQQSQNAEEKPVVYLYTVDGRVIGEMATGQLTIERAGQQLAGLGTFVGTVRTGAPEAGQALYKLTIHDALGAGKFLDLYLSANAGKLTHGFGTSPNFNNATHDVDVSQLQLEGQKLAGEVRVTVLPDPWIPKDHKPIRCAFAIQAVINSGEVTGTAGKFLLDGGLDGRPVGAALTGGTVKLEAGLMGDGGYHARAFVTFTVKDGKITGGKLWNNHSKLAGRVDGGEIRIANERLVGKIQATVTVGAGATEGQYEFAIDSLMVGSAGAGAFTTRLGSATKTGRLWAAVNLE